MVAVLVDPRKDKSLKQARLVVVVGVSLFAGSDHRLVVHSAWKLRVGGPVRVKVRKQNKKAKSYQFMMLIPAR